MNHIAHFAQWHAAATKHGEPMLPQQTPPQPNAVVQQATKPRWTVTVELSLWRIRIGIAQRVPQASLT